MSQRRDAPSYAAFALVCAVFGTTFLGIKIGVEAGAPPFLFAGIRFALAGTLLGLSLLASGRASVRSLLALSPRAAILSSLYVVVNFGASFWAERTIDSATAAQINSVGPVAAAALSALFLRKRLGPAHAAGMALGFAGVALIVRASAGAPGPAGSGGLDALAADPASLAAPLVMLVGALGFAGAQVLYKALFTERDDPFQVSAMNMAIGGVGLLALSAIFERDPFPASPEALGALAYLIVVGSIVGHSVNLWLIKRAGPVFASSWSYVSPVIATLVGFVVLGEKAGPGALAGTALTLAGVGLIAGAESASRRVGPGITADPSGAAAGAPRLGPLAPPHSGAKSAAPRAGASASLDPTRSGAS